MNHVEIDNSRGDEQKKRMQRHLENKHCHFCPEGFHEHTSPIEYENDYCFVTKNDFPYEGTVHHYLIVIKRHTTTTRDLNREEVLGVHDAVLFLEQKLKTDGYSLFVRSGNMKITGATLDHIHYHFIIGIKKENTDHKMIFAPIGYKK